MSGPVRGIRERYCLCPQCGEAWKIVSIGTEDPPMPERCPRRRVCGYVFEGPFENVSRREWDEEYLRLGPPGREVRRRVRP